MLTTLFAALPAASAQDTGTRSTTPVAAANFAAGVLERAYAGWHIGSVAFGYPGAEELEIEVIMVDAARTQAQAFQWIIPEDEQAQGTHHVVRAEVPGEARVYSAEKAFFDLLASDPPTTVMVQPGGLWQFRGRSAGVTLGEDHYHVVMRHVGGDKAPAMLASALASALDSHGTLIAVQASSPPTDRSSSFSSVDFVVQGDELQVIHALLDAQGRVAAVQLRRPGVLDSYDVYAHNGELLDSLRAGKSVQRMTVNRDGHDLTSIVLILDDGVQATIDSSDFYEEEVTGC